MQNRQYIVRVETIYKRNEGLLIVNLRFLIVNLQFKISIRVQPMQSEPNAPQSNVATPSGHLEVASATQTLRIGAYQLIGVSNGMMAGIIQNKTNQNKTKVTSGICRMCLVIANVATGSD